MANLVYKPGQRSHLFALRHLLPDPNDEDAYVAGPLVGVYGSSSPTDVIRQARRESLVFPPYVVVHVTGICWRSLTRAQRAFACGSSSLPATW
jgi:hypothetical protein